MSGRTGMRKWEVLLLLCFSVVFITAQVTFDPDSEEDIQLQATVLTPPVYVTTVQCYPRPPQIKVQYVTEDSHEVVYDVYVTNNTVAVADGSCEGVQRQYTTGLFQLSFIANYVLIGGTFKLKATVNNNEGNSTLSKRTYTFPAPFNLTGSSLSAVLNNSFTWTCHVTSDYPILEWYMNSAYIGAVGVLPDDTCVNDGHADSYIYGCQESALTYTLTIPESSLTEELQASMWRCKDFTNELKGSKFMELKIIVPVTSVTISPGSGSIFYAEENQAVTFTCITNDADPPPIILWFIGSSDVTSQASSNRSVITFNVTRDFDHISVKCTAWNSGNTANLSDSTTLNVTFSAEFLTDHLYQLERLNTTVSIEIPFYCNPPVIMSGVEWINMTGMNGQLTNSSETISFSLADDDVDRVIGNTNVTIRGQKAVMHITSVQRYHRGYYVIKIQNSASFVSSWGFILDVSVLPDPPANLTVQCREGVAQLSWSSPDIYSSELSFHLLYKEDDEDTYTVLEKEYDGRSKSLNANIRNIKPNTVYHFKIASKNVHGLSEYTYIKTCVIFDNNLFTSSTGPSIGGVAGGITAVFLVLTAVLIGVMVMRERRYRIEKGERVKENKASFEKYENIQSGSTSNEQGKEIENRDERSNYEELKTSRDVHTYDHVDNRTQYLNIEAC